MGTESASPEKISFLAWAKHNIAVYIFHKAWKC